jgi:hypothetical protein
MGGFVLVAALLALGGCANDKHLKPPPIEPEYVLPPNDPRYSKPPQFPDKTLNDWKRKQPGSEPDAPPGFPKRPSGVGGGPMGY